MMLDTLTRSADLLPAIDYQKPSGEPYGRNTTDAMIRGVHNAVHGTGADNRGTCLIPSVPIRLDTAKVTCSVSLCVHTTFERSTG